MYLVMLMFEDTGYEGRTLVGVCRWDNPDAAQIAKCANIALYANEQSSAVKHVAFNMLAPDIYEVDWDDDQIHRFVAKVNDKTVASFEENQQWYVANTNPFADVSSDHLVRTDVEALIVRVLRGANDRPAILSFSWELHEKHSGSHIATPMLRPADMREALKALSGALPAAIRLGYDLFPAAT